MTHPIPAPDPRATPPWQVLATAPLRQRLTAACHDILAHLSAEDVLVGRSWCNAEPAAALMYAYLDRVWPGRGHNEKAGIRWGRSLDRLEHQPSGPGLFTGFTMSAWIAEHLWGDEAGADVNEEIDDALERLLRRSPWTEGYDLVDGLVGIGVYAVSRLPRPSARTCLDLVLGRLEETAQWTQRGLTWHTPPHLLAPAYDDPEGRGHYNVGVAHGVPGVIGLLAHLVNGPPFGARARALLEPAVAWVLSTEQATADGPSLPSMIMHPDRRVPGGTAWCYGDLGVAMVLWQAGRASGQRAWTAAALRLARAAVARAPHVVRPADAGFCHGSAGLAHMMNRLFQYTGEVFFADAARYWLEQMLACRQPGMGIAGFVADDPDRSSPLSPLDIHLVTGAMGIVLVCAAACSPVAPGWDQIFLLSSPGRAAFAQPGVGGPLRQKGIDNESN